MGDNLGIRHRETPHGSTHLPRQFRRRHRPGLGRVGPRRRPGPPPAGHRHPPALLRREGRPPLPLPSRGALPARRARHARAPAAVHGRGRAWTTPSSSIPSRTRTTTATWSTAWRSARGKLKGTCLFFADRPGSLDRMAELVKRHEGQIVAARIHAYAPDRLPPFGKPELRAFWKQVGDLGLAVQLHFEPRYAPGFEPLIREFPRTTVIIDHLGRPFQGTPQEHAVVLGWAKLPNTVMKLSSLPEKDAVPAPGRRPGHPGADGRLRPGPADLRRRLRGRGDRGVVPGRPGAAAVVPGAPARRGTGQGPGRQRGPALRLPGGGGLTPSRSLRGRPHPLRATACRCNPHATISGSSSGIPVRD